MALSNRLVLDELIDAADARVIVDRDAAGRVRGARFDLAPLPRIDGLLAGRPVAEVPALVEHLCSICPAAHHLAGIRAVEALAGVGVTPRAQVVRGLLHHGAAVQAHAGVLARAGVGTARSGTVGQGSLLAEAAGLAQFARRVLTAVGAGRHFPETAAVGGVRVAVTPADRAALRALVPQALAAALAVARRVLAAAASRGPSGVFSGADVALVRADGTPDLLGTHLRAVAADGTVLHPAAGADRWDHIVREAVPGSADPRPYLTGPGAGTYRVGPVAQLRVGSLTTPEAATLQERWLGGGGAAVAARAVMAVHSVEAIGALLDDGALTYGPLTVPVPGTAVPGTAVPGTAVPGVGVGWVDGPRGLLVHRYAADADGTLTAATLLTPTAQNAGWLAEMLARVLAGAGSTLAVEGAIREADPCLPCTASEPGRMGVQVEDVPPAPSVQSSVGGR